METMGRKKARQAVVLKEFKLRRGSHPGRLPRRAVPEIGRERVGTRCSRWAGRSAAGDTNQRRPGPRRPTWRSRGRGGDPGWRSRRRSPPGPAPRPGSSCLGVWCSAGRRVESHHLESIAESSSTRRSTCSQMLRSSLQSWSTRSLLGGECRSVASSLVIRPGWSFGVGSWSSRLLRSSARTACWNASMVARAAAESEAAGPVTPGQPEGCAPGGRLRCRTGGTSLAWAARVTGPQ